MFIWCSKTLYQIPIFTFMYLIYANTESLLPTKTHWIKSNLQNNNPSGLLRIWKLGWKSKHLKKKPKTLCKKKNVVILVAVTVMAQKHIKRLIVSLIYTLT